VRQYAPNAAGTPPWRYLGTQRRRGRPEGIGD
jgi:hypothetical protein